MVLPDWPVNILKGTRMSEIESQTNDLLQLQCELDRIFTVLEGGTDLSKEQIDLLRYGCGFEPVNRKSAAGQAIWNMLVDTNETIMRGLK
jgi:hypothetical protein